MSEYSLVQIFGELPVDPNVFAQKLTPKLKWLGEAIEGND